MSDGAGKGDTRRPKFISDEEEDLRYKLAFGKITDEEIKKLNNLIRERIKK
jgi:hypothetical protein